MKCVKYVPMSISKMNQDVSAFWADALILTTFSKL